MSDASQWLRNLSRRLRSMDAFATMLKVQDDLRVRTASGGVISLIAFILILVLVASETLDFLTLDRVQNLTVDPGRDEKLKISFDIDMLNINCEAIGIDALDGTGNTQIEIKNHLFKTRIDHTGKRLEGKRARVNRVSNPPSTTAPASQPQTQRFVNRQAVDDHQPAGAADAVGAPPGAADGQQAGSKPGVADAKQGTVAAGSTHPEVAHKDCGSCMGAEMSPYQCCKTCADVRQAYERRGWLLLDLSRVPQCVREGKTQLTEGEFDPSEGCNVRGYVEVLKVAGTIHIAPGHSFNFHGRMPHDMSALDHKKINLSHRINRLSFGNSFPGSASPLDGAQRIVPEAPEHVGQYQYFTQVVPTTYRRAGGAVMETNQYSVTESFRASEGQLLPGVFFYYNLSPIKVEVVESRRNFFHFLVQLSAIVGGVFSMASMLDAGLVQSARAMRKRANAPLGKLM